MSNPGIIRMTEAEARRYGGKIKGFTGGGSTGHSTSSSHKRKSGKKFKRAGVFGGSGFLGLGKSRQRISARNRGGAMKTEGTPAQKRAWAKSRNNPTPKQLAARRRFARMSKARAAERKAALRMAAGRSVTNRSKKKPGQSRKNKKPTAKNRVVQSRKAVKRPAHNRAARSRNPKGKHLRGATAKEQRQYEDILKSGAKKRYGKRAKEVAARTVFARRHNKAQKHNAAVDQVFKTFVGRDSHRIDTVDFPNGSPTNLARLGVLTELVSETETFQFDESEHVYLASDARGNLYVGGKQQRVEPNTNFGHLLRISYVCKKPHIDNRMIEYVHKFGDEGGKQPRLRSDAEGRFLISGGAYTITSAGIAD